MGLKLRYKLFYSTCQAVFDAFASFYGRRGSRLQINDDLQTLGTAGSASDTKSTTEPTGPGQCLDRPRPVGSDREGPATAKQHVRRPRALEMILAVYEWQRLQDAVELR
jgi:hypothetical protein